MTDNSRIFCPGCGAHKTSDEFGNNPGRKYGKNEHCFPCAAKIRRTWRQKNRERVRESERRWKADNADWVYHREKARREGRIQEWRAAAGEMNCAGRISARSQPGHWQWSRTLARAARSRNVQRGCGGTDIDAPFLEAAYTAQGGRCYWFGVPMTITAARWDPMAVSIDRLDNSIGYTRANVVLSCRAANMGRGATHAGEFRKFCDTLRSPGAESVDDARAGRATTAEPRGSWWQYF